MLLTHEVHLSLLIHTTPQLVFCIADHQQFSTLCSFLIAAVVMAGIGRAVALAFAREGADVCITYLEQEEEDAKVCSA